MDAVAAETYLRCRLEDAVLRPDVEGYDDVLDRVRAVLAVGLIDDGAAERVVRDAASARRVRDDHPFERDDEDGGGDVPRVVVCPSVVPCDWGTLVVTHLVLDRRHTVLGVRGMMDAPSGPHGHHLDPWQTVEVLDPAGTKHEGYFNGGSSDTSFDGQYRLDSPIPDDAAWVSIAGHRIDLSAMAPALPVRVTTTDHLPIGERAGRHLALVQRDDFRHRGDPSEAARTAFDDLGVPVVDEPDATSRAARGGARRPPPRDRDAVPRLVALAADIPRLDGVLLNPTMLTDGGELTYTGRFASEAIGSNQPRAPFRIGAVDDLGTVYTSEMAAGGSSGSDFHGSVRLHPGLAPRATRLTIVIDTLRHRIEIDAPLDWQEAT